MIEELINKANELYENNKDDLNESKKYSIIKDILSKEDCFSNMSIEYAYSILRDLGVEESKLKETYLKLI